MIVNYRVNYCQFEVNFCFWLIRMQRVALVTQNKIFVPFASNLSRKGKTGGEGFCFGELGDLAYIHHTVILGDKSPENFFFCNTEVEVDERELIAFLSNYLIHHIKDTRIEHLHAGEG